MGDSDGANRSGPNAPRRDAASGVTEASPAAAGASSCHPLAASSRSSRREACPNSSSMPFHRHRRACARRRVSKAHTRWSGSSSQCARQRIVGVTEPVLFDAQRAEFVRDLRVVRPALATSRNAASASAKRRLLCNASLVGQRLGTGSSGESQTGDRTRRPRCLEVRACSNSALARLPNASGCAGSAASTCR